MPLTGCSGYGEAGGISTAASKGTDIATTYTQIVSATTQDWMGFVLGFGQTNAVAQSDQLCTLGIGSAGNEWDLISGLLLQQASNFKDQTIYLNAPIFIPAGSRLAGKRSSATGTVTMSLQGIPMGSLPNGLCQFATAYGGSGNTGTQIDPGGTINTKGSYAQITASTTSHIKYLAMSINPNANTALTQSDFLYDIAVGGAGSETVLFPNLWVQESANTDAFSPGLLGPFPCDIPIGSRLAVRSQSSINNATDRLSNVTLIGFS